MRSECAHGKGSIVPRRVTPSQFNRMVRQAQQKQRQAINNYNREVRRVNAHNKRVIDNYNRQVTAHNQRVRQNRRKLLTELNRLNSNSTTTTRYVMYTTSTRSLQRSFTELEQASERDEYHAADDLFEMAEGEAANSVATLNTLLDHPTEEDTDLSCLQDTTITSELQEISSDLDDRWSGALFALAPKNKDAARQFCTSSREILIGILNIRAPKDDVLAFNPDIELMNGQIPRREQINYCLAQSSQQSTELANFVDEDINNVMDLFKPLSTGTHGEAGVYSFAELQAIKPRVEGAIKFLHRIVNFSKEKS